MDLCRVAAEATRTKRTSDDGSLVEPPAGYVTYVEECPLCVAGLLMGRMRQDRAQLPLDVQVITTFGHLEGVYHKVKQGKSSLPHKFFPL